MVRHSNKLPDNLPQLQNLIKRDSESYKDEFNQQYRHFITILEVFELNPSDDNEALNELVIFIAQVAQCYPDVCLQFPQHLVDLLKNLATVLNPTMRNCFVKALILMRNKNLIPALDLLELFFQLLRCPDKTLRTFLQSHIITDIKNMNSKHMDMKLNSTLQNFMYLMLNDSNPKAAKMSADIMIELYKRNIWNDAKTVNVIGTIGCFSKITKVLVASLKFFLGRDEENSFDASESENDIDLKGALMQSRVNKKTKKRKKQLEQIKKLAVKAQKKKRNAPVFNFSAIHLIHNPQGLAEDLFKQLQASNERFEVKLMHLDVISRLIGIHGLFLFSYYPYIMRFLQPHQRQVTRILQFAAQASHELIPGDIIEPILMTIAKNFITERNSSDVMAIGLNATREICLRCPLAMSKDLLCDLAMYKTYKEKSVMMAARSLIMLYREELPSLLPKKERGRQTEAQIEHIVRAYGEVEVHNSIPGAEVLLKSAKTIPDGDQTDSQDEEWVDVSQGEEDDLSNAGEYEDDDDVLDFHIKATKINNEHKGDSRKNNKNPEGKGFCKLPDKLTVMSKKEAAQELSSTRIFTDEDFKRINAANLKKAITSSRKRPVDKDRNEFVKLDNIEMIYKKRKHDKEARLESVNAGRQDREKFGWKDGRKNKNCSKTNREKGKLKNFVMMRQKARSKIKKSFKSKQLALRNHLLNQKRMK